MKKYSIREYPIIISIQLKAILAVLALRPIAFDKGRAIYSNLKFCVQSASDSRLSAVGTTVVIHFLNTIKLPVARLRMKKVV
jgi:hypothetical protein